jgi:4-hydroxybenzoate polyprenyltransferase
MSLDAAGEHNLALPQRLWIYQRERFPLGRTAVLIAVFSAASISVSAHLAGRALPPWPAFLVAFIVTLVIFFQMRACDEVKDAEDDARYRPERPVPRGLVSGPVVRGPGRHSGGAGGGPAGGELLLPRSWSGPGWR